MTPEFSRRVKLHSLPAGSVMHRIEATAAECAALARRLGIPDVLALRAAFSLRQGSAGEVLADGTLEARTVRICVVSLDEFQLPVAERFRLRFLPQAAADAETDDDPDAPDVLGHDGVALDLGEAAAEQLALALDPYPRRPDAELPAEEAPPTPFQVLARLRRD